MKLIKFIAYFTFFSSFNGYASQAKVRLVTNCATKTAARFCNTALATVKAHPYKSLGAAWLVFGAHAYHRYKRIERELAQAKKTKADIPLRNKFIDDTLGWKNAHLIINEYADFSQMQHETELRIAQKEYAAEQLKRSTFKDFLQHVYYDPTVLRTPQDIIKGVARYTLSWAALSSLLAIVTAEKGQILTQALKALKRPPYKKIIAGCALSETLWTANVLLQRYHDENTSTVRVLIRRPNIHPDKRLAVNLLLSSILSRTVLEINQKMLFLAWIFNSNDALFYTLSANLIAALYLNAWLNHRNFQAAYHEYSIKQKAEREAKQAADLNDRYREAEPEV